jgi:hypothetical protein
MLAAASGGNSAAISFCRISRTLKAPSGNSDVTFSPALTTALVLTLHIATFAVKNHMHQADNNRMAISIPINERLKLSAFIERRVLEKGLGKEYLGDHKKYRGTQKICVLCS